MMNSWCKGLKIVLGGREGDYSRILNTNPIESYLIFKVCIDEIIITVQTRDL